MNNTGESLTKHKQFKCNSNTYEKCTLSLNIFKAVNIQKQAAKSAQNSTSTKSTWKNKYLTTIHLHQRVRWLLLQPLIPKRLALYNTTNMNNVYLIFKLMNRLLLCKIVYVNSWLHACSTIQKVGTGATKHWERCKKTKQNTSLKHSTGKLVTTSWLCMKGASSKLTSKDGARFTTVRNYVCK